MSVKNRLNLIKDLKFKTIKDFADAANLSYRTTQNYLSGDREPNLDSLNKICTHLGVNLNWLVSGLGEPFVEPFRQPEKQTETKLTADEQDLLAQFRQLNQDGKTAIFSMLSALLPKKVAEDNQVQEKYGTYS